ncbi:MAG TPA: RNA-directed DNA polymerase [Bacteroidales bacterium]|nr:RNA-directed DNA polymerase [Bacteroidales bacterium]
MKRAGNLIDKISEIDNLYLAFYKAAKHKRAKIEVREYEQTLDHNLKILQQQLLSENVEIGNYHYFKINDPKERTICAASFPERVLHHAIMNICHPVFERQLIHHTYATRPGKGTYAALDKAKVYVKKFSWFAKLDVKKYFDSISHIVLKQKLLRIFKDEKLIKIFDSIIASYQSSPSRGIPIGNLTSQYFANFYLSAADHYAIEELKIPGYIRYMDDILLFDNDKSKLKNCLNEFNTFVESKLGLSFKPAVLNNKRYGVSFLGYRILPALVKLNKNSKRRFCKKIANYRKLLNNGIWSQSEYSRHILPLLSFTEYAESRALRRNYFYKEKVSSRGFEPCVARW